VENSIDPFGNPESISFQKKKHAFIQFFSSSTYIFQVQLKIKTKMIEKNALYTLLAKTSNVQIRINQYNNDHQSKRAFIMFYYSTDLDDHQIRGPNVAAGNRRHVFARRLRVFRRTWDVGQVVRGQF